MENRNTWQITQDTFETRAKPLVDRTEKIMRRISRAAVDVVLAAGGTSRMPMIRRLLKTMSGRTLNTSLLPDRSIVYGAAYCAGMLLSNDQFTDAILTQKVSSRLSRSVDARALGILVRDPKNNSRVPFYLIPENSLLPAQRTHKFGTVVPNQKHVCLKVVESGALSRPAGWLCG